ncbi:hypothetical protein [endosymbiont GvMRE of Glomus versiforme]|uniref:hypothetical protein n=1 Tax=endosymbiont GvMRE of Glomus versiforme TaxID=2039283 RepID=UPI000EED34E0|nr:hypothetical protein [endosymbiont GvMRE of Glomus versiforme]RHZ35791.1 hypothetical protein GvMRE_Ic5g6 [endosymbiont GvMRE of Glomus versiforme]
MSKKWNCNCQEYLENQLKKFEDWQVNAKKKIEELLAFKECPYKTMDEKNEQSKSKTYYCSSTPIVPGEILNHVPIKDFLHSSEGYIECKKCGKMFRCSKQWIDKSATYIIDDYFPMNEHISQCKEEPREGSYAHYLKTERERERERESKPNYLPYLLGAITLLGLISILIYFLTRKKQH